DADADADADAEQVADAADTPPEALEAGVEPGDDAEAEQDVDSAIADETDSDDSDDTTKPA
ncbi:cupin domain-containing protein, partial [Xanthomonas citri pv. mangiferaeindicae]